MTNSASSHKRVTRSDVARYAGVSTAVVSYVVNEGPRPVAAATAERVRNAIRVLGYRPNVSAQALRTGTTRLLGFIFPEIDNPLWAEFALAVGGAAAKRGFDLILANSEGDATVERQHILNLAARQVDGIIITSVLARPDVAALPNTGIPTILLNTFREVPAFNSVGVDAFQGAYEGVQHLIGHGHTTVGLIIGGGGGADIELREAAWLQATRDAGLPDGPIGRDSFSREGGYRAGLRLFAGSSRPSAVFVSSDLQAIGLYRALYELGLSVPGDVAVVAFDGTKESEFTNPQLTVVQQPVEEMAATAIEQVLDTESVHAPRRWVSPATLVIRQSCGCR